MNWKTFSSCYQCADHILSTPINILVTANLRNLAQYSFLSHCYEGKEILVRRTRCTAVLCPDKWPSPGLNSSRKGIRESELVFTVAVWMGKHCTFLLAWMGWVKTAFWHTHPVCSSSAEGQHEMCCFCFTKLISFVKIDTECLAEADPSRIAHCHIVLLHEGGKGHYCNFSWRKDKIQPSFFTKPFQAVTVLSQLRWQEAILHHDEHVSLFSSQLSPRHYAYGREKEKRKKQKRRNLVETWICAGIRIVAQQVWALRLKQGWE